MTLIRVAIADDHVLFRAGLRLLLRDLGEFEVVAEASDGLEMLSILKSCCADVALVDLMMPGLNGLETTARITHDYPGIPVVILSMNSAEEFVIPSIRAGASGYLLKNVAPAELVQALRAVVAGDTYLTPTVSRHVVDDCRRRVDVGDSWDRLTPRQREVLQLVAEGHSTKEISARLGIALKTVETYRGQVRETLDIHDIANLTRYAIRHGLVSAAG